MRKVVFMIDGWFMKKRVFALKAFRYDGPGIRDYCKKHLRPDDYIYRIFYYDTKPLTDKGHNPLSKKFIDFGKTPVAEAQNRLLDSLRKTPNFALRLGKTVWRDKAWVIEREKLKSLLNKKISIDDLNESDIRPLIEQKAVDMKIGLDIASIATKRLADLLIIITGDADLVPALKHARKEGMQVCLDPLYNKVRPDLLEHVDFMCSQVKFPAAPKCSY